MNHLNRSWAFVDKRFNDAIAVTAPATAQADTTSEMVQGIDLYIGDDEFFLSVEEARTLANTLYEAATVADESDFVLPDEVEAEPEQVIQPEYPYNGFMFPQHGYQPGSSNTQSWLM